MNETSRRVRAALALAAVLFALAIARPAPPPAACAAPGELWAEAGHSVALICADGAPERAVRGPARRLVGLPIDPNRADAATLETLPGIGPARALAIVEARPFRRIEDLERVPGIGPRTLAGMAAAIAIEASPRKRSAQRAEGERRRRRRLCRRRTRKACRLQSGPLGLAGPRGID